MKRTILVLPALIAGLGLILAGRVTAQTFTTLHSFTATSGPYPSTNSDGANPTAGLTSSGNILYGTANQGGNSGNGTVFSINTDGTEFTALHSFTARSGSDGINSDGANPSGGLILSSNTLYGTAADGGTSGYGTVFRLNTDRAGFTTLHSFTALSGPYPGTNTDGVFPVSGVILSGNTLFGTASWGGSFGGGAVFRVNTDGTGFTNIYSFTAGYGFFGTNSDGNRPSGVLILSGTTLYGGASQGGIWGSGTIFAINIDGTGFMTLHSFTAAGYDSISGGYTNSDGTYPYGGLILSGNTLYGTTVSGGAGNGTVFALNADGTGLHILHSFIGNDEDGPQTSLTLSGNNLYGTTGSTVFAVKTDGTCFTTLFSLNNASCLTLSGENLYGTAVYGGSSDNGTVFSLFVPPRLTITSGGENVILTWPTNATGFTLQSAPAITGTFTNIPGATNPHTNSIAGAQQFFRLISN